MNAISCMTVKYFFRSVFIIFVTILNWRKTGNFFEDGPERFGICITHIKHYFVNIFLTGFETVTPPMPMGMMTA